MVRASRTRVIATSKHLSVEAARDAVEHAENGIGSSCNDTMGLYAVLFFLILPDDLPEIFSSPKTGSAVVMRGGDARVRVVQQRAGEIGIFTTEDGCGRSP